MFNKMRWDDGFGGQYKYQTEINILQRKAFDNMFKCNIKSVIFLMYVSFYHGQFIINIGIYIDPRNK